ncbi:MAG: hypothetical protein RML46_06640 [Anaerolineae bacterium]|nr:hypothetical protein [Anaerolineae bacterium]
MAILRPTVFDTLFAVRLGTVLRGMVAQSVAGTVERIAGELDFAGRSIAGRITIDSADILGELGRKLPVQLDVDIGLIAAAMQRVEGLYESKTIMQIVHESAFKSFFTTDMARGISRSFREVWIRRAAKGRPTWRPLADLTVELKKAMGLPDAVAEHPLLQWGMLLRSMTWPTFQSNPAQGIVRQVDVFARAEGRRVQVALQIEWGTSLRYAAVHMAGGRGSMTGGPVPARPFLPGYFEQAGPELERAIRRFRGSVIEEIRSRVRAQRVLARRALVIGRPFIGPRGGIIGPRAR